MQQMTGKPRAVTNKTRFRAALAFVCLAALVTGWYFLLGPGQDKVARPAQITDSRSLQDRLQGSEPAVFLRVRPDASGRVTGKDLPQQICIFQGGAVSVWKGTDRGVNLKTLGLGHDREILSMMNGSCFTDSEVIRHTDTGVVEVYRGGNLLFSLSPETVSVKDEGVSFGGWKSADEEGTLILVAGEQPAADVWEENDHLLSDPSWHDQFAFLQAHTTDPACEGRQDPGQRQVPKDDLEGLHPGHYEAVYNMNLRSSCHRDAGTVGSLPAGEQVDIELLERSEDNSVWGRIEPGKWVCLKDAEYQYLQPVGEAAE
ncbi:hypothetical protein [Faecalibaculum rodentium]|uniref:hypothetical protein n=2 Tax=Faecalibaculum rodentium TaxID=1702221 RepID=UPI0023F4720A|nr:hypothetical protein [Faecalibaculum rodentium]